MNVEGHAPVWGSFLKLACAAGTVYSVAMMAGVGCDGQPNAAENELESAPDPEMRSSSSGEDLRSAGRRSGGGGNLEARGSVCPEACDLMRGPSTFPIRGLAPGNEALTCGLRAEGAVVCYSAVWDVVTTQCSGFVSAAAGEAHVCALHACGDLYCWGSDGMGQLGASGEREAFEAVRSSESVGLRAVVAGRYFTCTQDGQGRVRCRGAVSLRPQAVDVGGRGPVLWAGSTFVCASGSGVRCFGRGGPLSHGVDAQLMPDIQRITAVGPGLLCGETLAGARCLGDWRNLDRLAAFVSAHESVVLGESAACTIVADGVHCIGAAEPGEGFCETSSCRPPWGAGRLLAARLYRNRLITLDRSGCVACAGQECREWRPLFGACPPTPTGR